MPKTRNEIVAALLKGEAVRELALTNAAQRRLFHFLLTSPVRSQGNFTDSYVQALKDAYEDEGLPAASSAGRDSPSGEGCTDRQRWLLDRIEASNVGGITAYGGGTFALEVGGESLCIDGHNGQGKTSLASLLTLALAGQRIGIHGPSAVTLARHPARAADGKASSDWPPVVSYPATFDALREGEPEAMVRLVFKDGSGREHVTERRVNRQGIHPAEPDLPPGVTPLHAELAVLVPNRVAHVRVNEETRLVEVLVELIGLESLRTLGEHAKDLCHGSKNFAGYPRSAEITSALVKAEQATEALRGDATAVPFLPAWSSTGAALREEGFREALKAARTRLFDQKAELFKDVQVDPSLDLGRAEGLAYLQRLSGEVTGLLGRDFLSTLPAMAAVKKVSALARPEKIEAVRRVVDDAQAALVSAREAAERQRRDGLLRLKAVAAQWHVENHPEAGSVEDCPLCGRTFSGDADQAALARDLGELRSASEAVTRTFRDACESIALRLAEDLAALDIVGELPLDPVGDLLGEVSAKLASDKALRLIVPEPTRLAIEATGSLARDRAPLIPSTSGPDLAEEERYVSGVLTRAERAIRLAESWPDAKPLLTRVREEILGKDEPGSSPSAGSLLGALETVQQASRRAAPIDEAVRLIELSLSAHEAWDRLQTERETREKVVEAITPLKGLVALVEGEARDALEEVTDGTVELFGRIYAGGPLALRGAGMDRRSALKVEGLVGEAVVDASHIANTSWLRAFLWAFAFTLRRQAVARLGYDPMPLLLLDDPQATFDHCNERQWAALLGEMSAGTDERHADAQLLVTSHDVRLFERTEFAAAYKGNRGAVSGICSAKGVLRIFHGGLHQRALSAFESDPRPETAQNYISQVRLIIEGKLSLILQIFGVPRSKTDIGTLLGEFDSHKDLAFFTTPAVRSVVEFLTRERVFRDILNASHHDADRHSLGEIEAREVNKAWQKFDALLEAASAQTRRFEFFGPRNLSAANVLPFPAPKRMHPVAKVNGRELVLGGRVAAATDGRVSWGDADSGGRVRLVRHGAVRLLSETLAPVATPGDLLILRQFGAPRDGDVVVTEVGGIKRARRLRLAGDDRARPTLLAEPNRSGAEPPLIVSEVDDCMRIVDGVLFADPDGSRGANPSDEVADVDREIDILAHAGSGGSVWRVAGDSASPVALNGQLLIVGNRVASREELRRLVGCPILAEVEGPGPEPERYFKRLRLAGAIVVLESIEPSGAFEPVVCSLEAGGRLPCLVSAAPVRGVLYEYHEA